MGSDDLFHKRKATKVSELARRKSRRASYAKVLIVCEGEKTEPNYFNGLKDHYGLNSANIEVCGECGSDLLSIVEFASDRYLEERNAGDPFDRVYCVFDKDTHASYSRLSMNTTLCCCHPRMLVSRVYSDSSIKSPRHSRNILSGI
ncbi:MAG: RloB family protein [Mariprofundaceae bacterium]|nr:RloB family protein [Mariprofundaceae bacterium]